MIKYQRFRREFMTWRMSQFKDVNSLNGLTELPYGSILHIFDNFPMDGQVDWGPRATNHFMTMNNFRVFMNNVTGWPEKKPTDVAPWNKEKIILTNGGVMSGTMKYMRSMMPRVKFVQNVADIPIRPSTMGVVNYNPLFRARVLGMYKKIRFFNFFLAQLCNRIMEAPDRQHFIHVPLENFTYEKREFLRVFKKFDRIATLYKERSTYLMLCHFYGILAKSMTLPARGKVAETEIETEEDSSVESLEAMHDLADEADLAGYDHINWMTNVTNCIDDCPTMALEALREGENPYSKSIFEFIPPRMFEKINFIFTVGSNYVCYNLRDIKELNGNANVGILRIINQLNTLVRSSEMGAFNDSIDESPMAPEEVTSITEEAEDSGNVLQFTKPLTHQEKIEAAEIDILKLDNVDKIIKQMPKTSSTAQKEHVTKLATAYKKLQIDGAPMMELLTKFDDDELTPPKVETVSTKSGAISSESTRSTISVLNKTYVEKKLKQDLAAIMTSFNKEGMFLTDLQEEKLIDDQNSFIKYTAKYEDTEHKKHTITMALPKIDKMGRTWINGCMKAMKVQRVSKPICKVSDTRVTLNTSFSKALIERNTNAAHSFIDWFMKKALYKINKDGVKLTPVPGICKFPIKAIPFEITEIGHHYREITFQGGKMFFDFENRMSQVPTAFKSVVDQMEEEHGVWFGFKDKMMFFIAVDGLVTVYDLAKDKEESFCGAFSDFIGWLTGTALVTPTEFIEIEYLGKRFPLIHMLAYRYGLTNMLKYCAVDYSVHDKGTHIETRPSDIIIQFLDKKLVINRNPRSNALLFGGLTAFDLTDTYLEDMDNQDVYYSLLDQKRISMNFIKGIESFFELAIDPITRSVLREMREPTDIRDLLLRAVTLLTTSDHLEPANEANFRYRGVEQITSLVYEEMARAFAAYKHRSPGSSSKFSISQYAIKQRIQTEQNMENVSTINPMEDIKSYSNITNAGEGGRTSDTFLVPDRRFTKDSVGIVSEATVDNGKTGMVAILPANPIMHDSRGMTEHLDLDQLEPENILSFNSLLMPGVTTDDSKRANFSSIQASAVVPMKKSEVLRVRTGYEELVAHRTRPPFAYSAEDEGVVVDVNDKAGVMVVRYKNGKKHCIQIGEQYSNNSSNGFFVNQAVVVNGYKKGDHFRKNDILTFNKEFFQADPYDKSTVRYRLGAIAKVAILDNGGTIEDASILTQPLCEKMVFNPVHINTIQITTGTNVRDFVHIGQEVNSTEPIIVFDESPMTFGEDDNDPELIAMLSRLNTTAPKAGHTGKVVKIEAFYRSPLSSMTPSLQKLIKHAVEKKNAQSDLANGCENSDEYLKSKPLDGNTKIGIIDMEPETVVLKFYIRQEKSMSPGDKLFFDSALKSVCSQVLPDYIMTEDGTKVEAATSARGILNRIISSPFTVGISESILEKVENDILAIWFGDESK